MSVQQHLARIGLVIAWAAAIQAGVLANSYVPSQDGVRFIRIASDFGHQPFAVALRRSPQHPLYPLLITLDYNLWGWRQGTGGEAWLASARRTAALAAILMVIPMYLVGLHLTSPNKAWAAAALFSVLPLGARVGADCVSESTYLLTMLTGVLGCMEFLQRRRIAWLMVAGLASGLAYWARPEGLVLPAAFVAAVPLIQSRPQWRVPWKPLLAGVPILWVSTLLVVAPYVLLTGRLTQKNSLGVMMERLLPPLPELTNLLNVPESPLSDISNATAQAPKPTIPLPQPPEGPLNFAHKRGTFTPRFRGYGAAVQEFVREFVDALQYGVGILALLGLRRARVERGNVLAIVFVVAFTAALVHFASRAGYLSTRHVMALVCLVCYTIVEGIATLARIITAVWLRLRNRQSITSGCRACETRHFNLSLHLRNPESITSEPYQPGAPATGTIATTLAANRLPFLSSLRAPARQEPSAFQPSALRLLQPRPLALALALALLASCLPRTLTPLHRSRQAHLDAGRWLADNTPTDALLLDTRGWAALFSDRPAYSGYGMREAFTNPDLQYVVLEEEELNESTPRANTLRHLMQLAGQEVKTFVPPIGPHHAVHIYRWDPHRLATLDTQSRRQ